MGAPRGGRARTGLVVGWLVLVPVSVPLSAASQALPEAPRASQGRIIDRVVAVIGNQVLTLSELEFETRVALVQRGGVRAAEASLDEQTLRGALELAINQRLLVAGADRLQAFPAERSEVDARLKIFRERFEDEPSLLAFLARHDADLEQLTAVLERGVRAERILDSRIRLRAQVSESETRRYWEEHKGTLGGPYESVRDALRERLMRERYGQLAKEEFALVRAGAKVRRVAPFAREALP
ncbi:hypothetical protein JQX13_37515 [Archangium violaceum]|uniref:hypothetical protein n=1 Tax=Archangium violaceum TaxID=83451 RepID=UPI00193BA38B|nr:hypothetical protein [Archangium violaceum]QRK05800.1 hypothetical protein JQX13_37515 [Archangium violaceum]